MTDAQETVVDICEEMFDDVAQLERCGCKMVATERVNAWRQRIVTAYEREMNKAKGDAK